MAIIVVAKAFWSSLYGKRVPDLMSVNICLMSSWAQSLILSDIQWKKCMSFTRFKKFICAHWLPGVIPVISQWANSWQSVLQFFETKMQMLKTFISSGWHYNSYVRFLYWLWVYVKQLSLLWHSMQHCGWKVQSYPLAPQGTTTFLVKIKFCIF